MTRPTSHDAYMDAAPEAFCDALRQLRDQLAHALPDAEAVIKYAMPGFQIGDAIVAGYTVFSRQCGLYVDPAAIAACADAISAAKLKATKTGVTFSARHPMPEALVMRLAYASRRAKGV